MRQTHARLLVLLLLLGLSSARRLTHHGPDHHIPEQEMDSHASALVREVSQKINRGEAVPGQITLGEAKEYKPYHRRSLKKRHKHRARKRQDRTEAREPKALAALQRELTLTLVSSHKKPKSAFVKQAPSKSDQALKGPMQPNCAWQAYITGEQYNVAYPDLQAVYQVLVMMNVNEKKIFRIKATFPTDGVRYFSLQSNNPKAGFPISTIKDYELIPDDPSSMINPFASNNADLPVGTYTIYVTPRGDQGFPNELALCPDEWPDSQCKTMNAVMLMRFYTTDPDQLAQRNSKTDPPASESNPRLFGYAGAPVVEERTIMGWNGDRSKDKYRVFTPCDQKRPTKITSMITNHFTELIPPWKDPIRPNLRNNFVLYLGEQSSKAGVYPNLDATYLSAIAWQKQAGIPPGARIVAKVTGTLPITARNFKSAPKIPNWQEYDVRYASFSTLAMVEGGPTCDTIDDSTFWRFYDPEKTKNWDRKFTFVVAESEGKTCGLYNATTDLFLSSSLDGVPQDYWSILDRQLVPKTMHTRTPDKSNGWASIACTLPGEPLNACVNGTFLEGVMEEYYPKIEWYLCEDGKLTQPEAFKQERVVAVTPI